MKTETKKKFQTNKFTNKRIKQKTEQHKQYQDDAQTLLRCPLQKQSNH